MSKKEIFWNPYEMIRVCPDAKYYIAIGERSNGKTFGVKELALDDYLKRGKQLAYIRRWEDDFKKAATFYDDMINNETRGNIIATKTKGKYNGVRYTSRNWYLVHYDEKGEIDEMDEKPFAIAFALTMEEHYKSFSFPDIETIFLDEFMTRRTYVNDEFLLFMSLISTIVRLRDTPRIFMCANTITSYNPYFVEMGIKTAGKMKDGDIDVYTYGESALKVCIQRTDALEKKAKKASNIFFAFSNPKLRMNTSGAFEISIYPHLPFHYLPKEIKSHFFIQFNGETFHGEIIYHEKQLIAYIHRKTTPIKDEGRFMVFSEDVDPRRNYSRDIFHPHTRMGKIIATLFAMEKVFYQDNEVGESVNHYLNWASQL